MVNLTIVNLVNGVPTDNGTVSTLDALMADGGQVTIGAKADAAAANSTQTASLVAINKGILSRLALANNDSLANNAVSVVQAGAYNGTNSINGTIDRVRGNFDYQANLLTFTTANSTGSPFSSADQTNYNGRGLQAVFVCSANSGTCTVTLTIQGKEPLSGQYYTIFTGPAWNANTTSPYLLTVYPGTPSSTNSSPQVLPRTWRVQAAIASGSNTVSGRIAASVIV